MTMKRLVDDPGFRSHFIVYLSVNLLLAVINFVTNPQSLWFFWPLAGWGIGVLGHAILVLSGGSAASER
jgi:2TM domain